MQKTATDAAGLLNLINRTLELPTLPEVLLRMNEVMANSKSSVDDVARVIATDPAVAANILRLVNSAYYGLQVRVSTVSLAVSVMGFAMTSKIALKAAVFSRFAKRGSAVAGFDPEGFWRHSIFSAVAARTIGRESERFANADPEDLYTCGLLHDIGKILLFEKMPERYAEVLGDVERTGRPETEAERDVLGFTHAEAGSVLAIKWSLPEDLAIAIRYHHAPDKDTYRKSLSHLIHLADHLAWSASFPSTRVARTATLEPSAYDELGIDPARVEELLPQIHEDFEATGLPW
jgi:putative nucleotidyltransferase with HDIG domain